MLSLTLYQIAVVMVRAMALYVAIGGLVAARCRFADARRGWRGQVALMLATLVVAAIWPVLLWHALVGRIRTLFG